jgi:branched-chain amino acid aminotransferase
MMIEIKVTKTSTPKQKPAPGSALGFGKIFTDHMFLMNYDTGEGWHDARIVPYAPLELDPAAMCFHYAQEVFEGLKAYKRADGKIQLFRPEKNIARLNVSNDRLCIPKVDEAFVIEAIKKLVSVDADWMPTGEGESLYVRPFIIAVDAFVGVHPAHHLIMAIILSPSGAYYPNGIAPVKIYVESNYVRAVPGTTGFTKAAANYAISLKAQDDAEKEGYIQVLWLDGIEHKYVEEVGSMNVFFVIGDEVVTPALHGSVLSGITRMSCIELCKQMGYKVSERRISIDEVIKASDDGTLKEAFGTGTAAVISPIGELRYGDREITVNNNEIGEISQKLYDTLTGIQWGKIPDSNGWTQVIGDCCCK